MLPIGAIISSAIGKSVLPSVITGAFGLGASAINHFSQRALSNNAFRQNVALWNQQNQYNSPSAQVGRLVAAGLNPALAYGGSSQVVGNSDTPPQLDYRGVANQPLISPDAVMQAQQVATMMQDRALVRSQIAKNDAETIESLNRGALSGAESRYAEEFAKEKLTGMRLMNDQTYLGLEHTNQSINNLIATRNLTKEQIRSLELANEFNDRVMEYKIESVQLSNLESRKRMQEINVKMQKYQAEIGVMSQTARKLMTENQFLPRQLTMDLSKGMESVNSMRKNQAYLDASIKNLSVRTGISEKELDNWFWTNIMFPSEKTVANAVGTGAAIVGGLAAL